MWNGAPSARTPSASSERLAEPLGLEERAVARRVHVREVDDGSHPADAAADLDALLERAEVVDAAHDLDPERRPPGPCPRAARARARAARRPPRSSPRGCGRAGTRDGRRRPRRRTRRRSRRCGRARRAPTTTCARSPRDGRPSRRAARARTARDRARVRARRAARPTGSPSRSPTRSRSRTRRSPARAGARPPASGLSRSGTRAGPTRMRPMCDDSSRRQRVRRSAESPPAW